MRYLSPAAIAATAFLLALASVGGDFPFWP